MKTLEERRARAREWTRRNKDQLNARRRERRATLGTAEEGARRRARYYARRDELLAERRAKVEANRAELNAAARARYARKRERLVEQQRARRLATAGPSFAQLEQSHPAPVQAPPPPPEVKRFVVSEAPDYVMAGRIRNALIRLLSAARTVDSLANMLAASGGRVVAGLRVPRTPAPETLKLVEQHVLECYQRFHVRSWDKIDY